MCDLRIQTAINNGDLSEDWDSEDEDEYTDEYTDEMFAWDTFAVACRRRPS